MKVLVIEDEKPASQKLMRLLGGINPDIEVVEVLKSVEASINWFLHNPKPDLIFMDVQLEDGICFEIFEKTPIHTPIIFTTAYDEYTLKAFKVNSIDYLLKPIDLDELKNAIDKFKTYYAQKVPMAFESIVTQLQPNTKERFLVRIGDHYKSIQTSNINCFYIKERCNFILVDNGKRYAIDYSLDKIEELVDSKSFYRINRSLNIKFTAIQDIIVYSSSRLKILLKEWNENEDIIVSRERVSEFKEWMDR
jgi:DNA-binding LytR/AlgR family response regulator